MKVVHVLRKPCSESTVAANVLRHGTGALNIDKTRIGDWQTRLDPACNKGDTGRARFNTLGPVNTTGYTNSETKNGRWPANLILQHLPTCEQTGTREEPGYTVNRFTDGAKPFGGGAGHPYESEHVPPSTVPVWTCAPGCPVAGLDAQSGLSHSPVVIGRGANRGQEGWGMGGGVVVAGFGDTGGASRFFKQVKP